MVDTWTMRDGTKIAIKNMTTSHIINSLRMLERNKEWIKQREVYNNLSLVPSGDMASLDYENYMMDLYRMTPDEFLEQYPVYVSLKRELERRGVSYIKDEKQGSD